MPNTFLSCKSHFSIMRYPIMKKRVLFSLDLHMLRPFLIFAVGIAGGSGLPLCLVRSPIRLHAETAFLGTACNGIFSLNGLQRLLFSTILIPPRAIVNLDHV